MTGEALDHKTPLLRSQQAMAKQADASSNSSGIQPRRRLVLAGPEQEYFLIDRDFLPVRPDLFNTGRTLFGDEAPQGPGVRRPLLRGHPRTGPRLHARRGTGTVQTRHPRQNPSQRSRPRPVQSPPCSNKPTSPPTTSNSPWSSSSTRPKTRAGMPFPRKALRRDQRFRQTINWSLGNGTEGNLLLPGDNPHDNAQFLVFCAAVIRAVHKYAGLLRASVASATNDHRLGANEAPPPSSASSSATNSPTSSTRSPKAAPPTAKKKAPSPSASTPSPSSPPNPATATAPAPSRSPGTASSSALPAPCNPSPGP